MSTATSATRRRDIITYTFLAACLVGLYFTTHINYLLFHTLAEFFSIAVAFSLFMITWNSRQYIKNPYLLFIGIAYLFIGALDFLHALSYKGMPIFTSYDFYANELWICARYMESLTLLLGFYFLYTKRTIWPYLVFTVYTLVTAEIIASVFYWKIFPECFVAGQGLTPFKIISEYIICGILVLDIFLLNLNKATFEKKIYGLLLWSLIFTIISELAFTFYVNNYGFSNLVGHYFKIFSFMLIYEAIIKTGIEKPYELIFHELDNTNKQLHTALDEIKQLQGIVPICMHCKKIRDDSGYWNQLEQYLHDHAGTKFSHGICPECVKEYYPYLGRNSELH